MTEAEREALARVLQYMWEDELEDYGQQEPEFRRGHIFEDLETLSDYLNRPI